MKKTLSSLIVLALFGVMLTGCSSPEKGNPTTGAEGSGGTEMTSGETEVITPTGQGRGMQFEKPKKGDTIATMSVEGFGDIKIKFFPKQAPKTVENFTTHAKNGYYDGLTFHRILEDFMIQGGDPKGTGVGGESIWGKSFKDEFSKDLHNFRGALSMANSGPNTNGSQFFIVQTTGTQNLEEISKYTNMEEEAYNNYKNVGGTCWLDGGANPQAPNGGHTVFGQVYEGMDVVDKIAAVEVDSSGVASNKVVISKVTVETVK